MIDQFLITIGFEDECEPLTLLAVQPQTLLELGLVMTDVVEMLFFDQKEFYNCTFPGSMKKKSH